MRCEHLKPNNVQLGEDSPGAGDFAVHTLTKTFWLHVLHAASDFMSLPANKPPKPNNDFDRGKNLCSSRSWCLAHS
eukprot:4264888-Amphidinium_carterae.1